MPVPAFGTPPAPPSPGGERRDEGGFSSTIPHSAIRNLQLGGSEPPPVAARSARIAHLDGSATWGGRASSQAPSFRPYSNPQSAIDNWGWGSATRYVRATYQTSHGEKFERASASSILRWPRGAVVVSGLSDAQIERTSLVGSPFAVFAENGGAPQI